MIGVIIAYWFVGFIGSIGIALPFVMMNHVKRFASAAGADIAIS